MLNSSSWYDYSDSVVYNADIVSIAVITVSILGFPIIFSVATWLSTQSKIPFPEEATTEEMLRYLKDPSERLLRYFTEDKTVGKFLISSMIYLFALLLSLINYCIYIFFNNAKFLIFTLLICSLFLVLIASGILFCTLIIMLIKGLKVDKKDVAEVVKRMEWLLRDNNHKPK
ncbi:MAG: hypothetical protein GQ523_10450 [Methanophagales archaeon]|jgi:hypothetical protein|nr:hypothetical protein [Methanophagales archaeon]